MPKVNLLLKWNQNTLRFVDENGDAQLSKELVKEEDDDQKELIYLNVKNFCRIAGSIL